MNIVTLPRELVIKTIQAYVISKGIYGKVYAFRVRGSHIWFNMEGVTGSQVDLIDNIFKTNQISDNKNAKSK